MQGTIVGTLRMTNRIRWDMRLSKMEKYFAVQMEISGICGGVKFRIS